MARRYGAGKGEKRDDLWGYARSFAISPLTHHQIERYSTIPLSTPPFTPSAGTTPEYALLPALLPMSNGGERAIAFSRQPPLTSS